MVIADTPAGLPGYGKLEPSFFLPLFSEALLRQQLGLRVALTSKQASAWAPKAAAAIFVFNEEYANRSAKFLPTSITSGPQHIFNNPQFAQIIADKEKTHRHLASFNISTTKLANADGKGQVFSNARANSRAETHLYDSAQTAPAERFNTEYVDTTFQHNDKSYYTMVRLMVVGDELSAGLCFARDASEQNPSVHALDTPLDPTLLQALHRELVDGLWAEHQRLAKRVSEALGFGFWHIDVLIEKDTLACYVCEVGMKFHNMSYFAHLNQLEEIPREIRPHIDRDYPRRSAEAFLRCIANQQLSFDT
ncbi:hypothetical protein R0135_07705 [Congregibacter variabilis]|uniref:ATP-grasp domain-containing protein n=1 Tax=Congregibacter variabilis TaxID=3081200 RepID=A0ABZ0I792_9GAMM|nr:hypothetical protein R0135_07705 [Congregibacter sp. IMCC43200]